MLVSSRSNYYGAINPSLVGLVNPAALATWFESLHYAYASRDHTDASHIGFGGVDVILIGDSLAKGFNGTISYLGDSAVSPWHTFGIPAMIRNRLQLLRNPDGVDATRTWTGGMGFVPFVNNHVAASPAATAWPSLMSLNPAAWGGTLHFHASAPSEGVGGRYVRLQADATDATRVQVNMHGSQWNGTPFLRHPRLATTKMQVVGNKKVGAGTINIDANASTAAPANRNTGTYKTTWDMSAGATVIGSVSPVLTLDTAGVKDHTIRLFGPAAGGDVELSGLICYNDDWDRGVRVHDFTAGGQTANHFTSTNLAGFDYFTSGFTRNVAVINPLPGGAINTKLVIIELGTNDINTGRTAAQFKTDLLRIVDYFIARPTSPSILIRVSVKATASRANWNLFVQAIYEVMEARPAKVAILDNDLAEGRSANRAASDARFDNDSTHYSPIGVAWSAERTLQAIGAGL